MFPFRSYVKNKTRSLRFGYRRNSPTIRRVGGREPQWPSLRTQCGKRL